MFFQTALFLSAPFSFPACYYECKSKENGIKYTCNELKVLGHFLVILKKKNNNSMLASGTIKVSVAPIQFIFGYSYSHNTYNQPKKYLCLSLLDILVLFCYNTLSFCKNVDIT